MFLDFNGVKSENRFNKRDWKRRSHTAMRNRIARAFAVLSCGCLLLGSCEVDRISVETGEVGEKLTSAAAGLSAAAVVNFDKVLDKAEQQGLLHIDADVERKLQDAGVGVLDASVDVTDTALVSGARAGEDGSVAEQKADGDESVKAEMAGNEAESDIVKSNDKSGSDKGKVNSDSSKNSESGKNDISNADRASIVRTENTGESENEDTVNSVDDSENNDSITGSLENSKNSEDSENENDKDDKNKVAKTYGYKNIGIANVRTSLNVREKATKSSRRIGSMLPDAACEIKGYEGDWAKIKSGDVTGYVMASYLLTDEEAEARADLLMSDSVTVNADVLRVRESASIHSRIITRVNGGTKLVLADVGDSEVEFAQNAVKQEQSGAPPGKEDDEDLTAKSVEKKENSDNFASIKVKDSIEIAKNDTKTVANAKEVTVDTDEQQKSKSKEQAEKSEAAIKTAEKAPPDDESAFDDASEVRTVDEIGDNGWVEIELSNGRFGYVSTDYVEVSTELSTASALYAPDPIDKTVPAVTVADVVVSENVTVAAERVEDDVSTDSDSGGDNDRADDPGGGASEDDSGIAEAPANEDIDGGEADVTDSEDADSSDDGSELTEDEQTDGTDAEKESEDTKKADKGGEKKHTDKKDGNADESQNSANVKDADNAETAGDAESSDNGSAATDNSAEADDVAPAENTESAPVAPSVDASTSDPASFAMQFLGNPYVWGGSSLTNGADCSGFVMSVYANYGISLPHSSAAQSAYGTRISAAEAVPGDLFFYGSGTINHVGIYVGNGQIIHASNKRTGIKLSNAYYQTPVCVTRLMN